MNTKTIKNKERNRKSLHQVNIQIDCEVSKASTEIMLDRFSNGRDIEFPFSL